MKEVEVVTAQVDLNDVGNYRTAIASRGVQAAKSIEIPRVDVDFYMVEDSEDEVALTKESNHIALMSPEEEIGYGPACWLWDYLRRSTMNGFFLPLSGGTDSATSAAMVSIMCQMLFNVTSGKQSTQEGESVHAASSTKSQTLAQLRKVVRDPKFDPKSPQDIAGKLFYCCFMKTKFSTAPSQERAQSLAKEIGANFDVADIDPVIDAMLGCYQSMSGIFPDVNAPNTQQNVAVQNLQCRSRMVFSYLCAQMNLQRKRQGDEWPGSLLVIGASNLDACLAGHYTKFGESSADVNPIGSLSKVQMIRFLKWAAQHRNMPTLARIALCAPSNELQPLFNNTFDANAPAPINGYSPSSGFTSPNQSTANHPTATSIKDEYLYRESTPPMVVLDDAARFYDEYDQIAALRMNGRLGPFSMFRKLMQMWGDRYSPEDIANRVKDFFVKYAKNRHKATVLPPAYHLENHSADDNRFDMRQIIYDTTWRWQFDAIDRQLQKEKARKRAREEE
eukprot:GILJ01023440.1.p1 GENE.GILJ01023440.1~~GILJ01023440.1.p1  ORF type:complete len:540 (+),score=91.83 GILJ01023440.1:107-1621(+)